MKKIPLTTVRWWHTPFGRTAAMFGVVTVAAASGLSQVLPHSVFKDFYIRQVHVYSECEMVDTPDTIIRRFDECLKTLDMSAKKTWVRPFTVCGFELYTIGSMKSRYGAHVGIPINYQYESESDIDKSNIQVGLKPVDWGVEAGRRLAATLVLPERLRDFGICREILASDNHKINLNALYATLPYIFVYTTAKRLNERYSLLERHASVRIVVYALLSAWAAGVYFFAKDYTNVHLERRVDEALCKLGPEYIKSGVDFYENILQRNIALRTLLGPAGADQFSRKGDVNFTFRYKTTPLTDRKKFFETKLQELESAKSAPA